MGDDDEHTGGGAEALEGLLEIGDAAVFWEGQGFDGGFGKRDLRELGSGGWLRGLLRAE
jgi:hypothetical protein